MKRALILCSLLTLVTSCQRAPSIDQLVNDDPRVREPAVERLPNLKLEQKEKLIPPLMDKLRENDGQVSDHAMTALAALAPMTIPTLIKALDDSNAYIRMTAATLLGRTTGGTAAIEPLIRTLKDVHPLVREEAAIALGNFGAFAQTATPALKALLNDKDENVRTAVRQALERIKPTPLANAPISSKTAR